jgi:plastocyanin
MNGDQTRRGSPLGKYILPVVLAALVVMLASCSTGGTSATATSAAGSKAGANSAGGRSITIHNFMFSPATLTVPPGATVKVTNMDQVTHTLTASKGEFNTGDISPGQSKTFTAPMVPGRYGYICSIHQYMSGTIVVSG